MRPSSSTFSRAIKLFLIAGVIALGLVGAFDVSRYLPNAGSLTPIAAAEPVSAPAEYSPDAEPAEGNETCAACHEQIGREYRFTAHGKVDGGRGEQCAACHGEGMEHIAGDPTKIMNPKKVSAREASLSCMTCHSQVKSHSSWMGSRHDSAGLSCLDCHSMHHSKAMRADFDSEHSRTVAFNDPVAATNLLTERTEAETCATCHQDVMKAKFQRSTHLFRNEDGQQRMLCSSCHEPHGSIGDKLMRTSTVNETCYSCHAEKRGPFLWEHAPVRENCMTCHSPHGSNNTALLQKRTANLCQQCHIQGKHQTVAGKPNSTWMMNRSCTNCHSAIHGSNHPSGVILMR
jgi:DmsE family decaheme c-type cytochrome